MNDTPSPTTIRDISLYLIQPSRLNPRKTIDKDSLRELADNIARQGLLQPITVRPVDYDVIDQHGSAHGVEYEIVCGERRYRACSLLALDTIPCIVRDMTDDEALDAMITENLQRVDVDPIEEAEAFNLLRGRGQTVEELALRFGKSERYVRDRMRLVSLTEPLQKALSIGQIPLKGAYLLSRLSDDDQKEFFDDELEGEHELNCTADDVESWLDRKFMNLHSAPFQEKGNLRETWNPGGNLIRRCDTCECNTNNHGCLFADMRKEEPQCTDETCYNRKLGIYIGWFISQYDDRIVRVGEPAAPGKMHIVDAEPYGEDAKRRYNALRETLRQKGYRLFTEKEMPICYGPAEEMLKKGMLKKDHLVEGLKLDGLASGYNICVRYFICNAAEVSATVPAVSPAGLLERAASIETAAQRKALKFAREHFDREAYVNRQDTLNQWEENFLLAIIFDQMTYNDRNDILPGCGYGLTSYQQAVKLGKMETPQKAVLMRKAIATYCDRSQNNDFFLALASRISTDVDAYAAQVRTEARQRIDVIHEELREMGYDEKGKRL